MKTIFSVMFSVLFIIIYSNCSNMDINNVNYVESEDSDESVTTATADGANSLFRDGWNLDAGLDSRPIGTLVIRIHTSDKWLAGTDSDIYFGMQLADGRVYQRLLDKAGYNDFERDDYDDYYLYVGDKTFYPQNVTKFWLKNVKSGAGPDWHIDYIKVSINGVLVYTKSLKRWIDANKTYTMSPVNLPSATDIPVPIGN